MSNLFDDEELNKYLRDMPDMKEADADGGIAELMSDPGRLVELGDNYIAEVESRAAEILAVARAEAERTAEALRNEVYDEIAAMKAEAELYCQDKKDQADKLLRDAETAAADAEAEAEETRMRAKAVWREARDFRDYSVNDRDRIENDRKEYLDALEKHMLAKLNIAGELLKNQQEWALRAKQSIDELSEEISRFRTVYEEDHRY